MISLDTDEVEFSRQRHKILIDQGFQHEIMMAKDYNLSGMKIQPLDEKDHLVYILSEHEEGDQLLSRGTLLDKRPKTKLALRVLDEEEYYY